MNRVKWKAKTMGLSLSLQLGPQGRNLLPRSWQLRSPLVVFRTPQAATSVTETGKHRLQRVIVTLEDGIELVIMTTGASNGETEERLTNCPDHLIKFILSHKKFEKNFRKESEIPEVLKKGIRTRSGKMFSVLTHELGYFLGQQIFDGFRQGLLSRTRIRNLFNKRFEKPGAALEGYLSLVEELPASIPAE